VKVSESITVTGTVVGYEATPFGAEVPGIGALPIEAQVTLTRPGTISGATITTDAQGRFSLSVPPASGYQLSIVPIDNAAIPFLVEPDLLLVENTNLETIDLGYGEPVFGTVTYEDGTPVNALVRAVDPASGVEGATTTTNELGHYMLRTPTGAISVVASGAPGSYLPTITQAIDVQEEDGADVDIDMGEVSPVQVSGTVVGQENRQRQKDIKVRFRSSGLNDTDGDLEVETETDGDGLFSRNILPGEWLAEFIPPFDSGQSPAAIAFTLGDEDTPVSMDQIELADRVQFNRRIVDPNGDPLPGAVLNAQEKGFDGYIYSATADNKGRVDIELPAVDMVMTVVPPTTSLAVTQLHHNPATHSGSLAVAEGQPVVGVVRSEGVGVQFALVEVRREDGTLLASTVTGPQGEFAIQIEASN
jgi:hypothetical protein